MIYANDLWIQLPVKDLYDSLIMLASIQAARDLYKDRRDDLKDFYSKYEDFYSPIAGATEEVYNESIGKIKKGIDQLYAAGGDVLRSPDAYAKISQLMRSVDVGKINRRRQEAKDAEEYLKNMAKAILAGTYNPDMEKWLNGGKTFDEWTAADGYWKSTTPGRYTSQDARWGALASQLTPEFDAVKTAQMKDGYDYNTVSDARIRKMIDDNIDNMIANDQAARYEYEQAVKELGSSDAAKEFLRGQYFNTAKKYTKEERKINEYNRMRQLANETIRAHRENKAIDQYYEDLQWDIDGNRKLDETEREYKKQAKEAQIKALIAKGGKDNSSKDIFQAALERPGVYIEFPSKEGYDLRIMPASSKIKNGGDGWYSIGKDDLADLINQGAIIREDGTRIRSRGFKAEGKYFKPDGYVVYRNGGFYMSGTLQQDKIRVDANNNVIKDQNLKPVHDQTTFLKVLVPIIRRDYDKQTK